MVFSNIFHLIDFVAVATAAASIEKFGCTNNSHLSTIEVSLLCTKTEKRSTNSRVIEVLRVFEFRNWHLMRGGLMLPDSISEECFLN